MNEKCLAPVVGFADGWVQKKIVDSFFQILRGGTSLW